VFMKLRMSLLPMLLGLTMGSAAFAQNGIMYFRYYDDKHQEHIDQQVSDDALTYGYDELDRNLNVVRSVAPRLTARDMERVQAEQRKKEEAEEQAKNDALLHQLYSSPADALRERDRQLEAIQLRIDYDKNNINRLRFLRNQEAERAAGQERNGQAVSKDTRDTISGYDKQIVNSENDIKAQQAAQADTSASFEPKIRRLTEMQAAQDAASNGGAGSVAPAVQP